MRHEGRKLHTCYGIFIDSAGRAATVKLLLQSFGVRSLNVTEAYASVATRLLKVSGR